MILQVARDHTRLESLLDEAKYNELEESLQEKRMWSWMAKVVRSLVIFGLVGANLCGSPFIIFTGEPRMMRDVG